MVGGYPAQVVTAEVQEQGKPVATEQVAFIDADDVLYTVALQMRARRLPAIAAGFPAGAEELARDA